MTNKKNEKKDLEPVDNSETSKGFGFLDPYSVRDFTRKAEKALGAAGKAIDHLVDEDEVDELPCAKNCDQPSYTIAGGDALCYDHWKHYITVELPEKAKQFSLIEELLESQIENQKIIIQRNEEILKFLKGSGSHD